MKLIKKLCCLCLVFALCTAFLSNYCFAVPDKALNIVFVGDEKTGKTALRGMLSEKGFDFTHHKTTYASDVLHPVALCYQDKIIQCCLTDTTGDPRAKDAIIEKRLESADIVVLVLDASRRDYIETIKTTLAQWAFRINEVNDARNVKRRESGLPDRRLPILYAATKTDDPRVAANMPDITRRLQNAVIGTDIYGGVDYVTTSALKNTNLGDRNLRTDFGDNFWGKIRCIIRGYPDRNIPGLYDQLEIAYEVKRADGDYDNVRATR